MPNDDFKLQDNYFNWDRRKNLSNIRKHGVSFKEAATVFLDPFAEIFDDEINLQNEERFIVIGVSKSLNLLMVCHCYRENGEIIRIISGEKRQRQNKNCMEVQND